MPVCVKAFGLQKLTQIRAVHEFHDEEVELFALTEVEYVDDGGVTKPGHGSCLTCEAFGKRRIVAQIRPHQFYGNKPIKLLLASLIDDPHATDADLFDDLQFRKETRPLIRSHVSPFRPDTSVGASAGSVATWSLLSKPTCIRHFGQCPGATSAGSGAPHFGQI